MNITMRATSAALAIALFFAGAAGSQTPQNNAPPARMSYSDLVDLALAAQVTPVVTVHDTIRLKGPDAAGVAPGETRLYVEGDVDALLAGAKGIPAQVSWLVDLPLDSANRPPKLKKDKLILLARAVPGKPGVLQLVSKHAQLPWSPELEQTLRGILGQLVSPSAPPVITGIGHAFHVAGTIPGEGETQIFLTTADNRPVSIDVQRHPGEDPHWAVSLGDIVDVSASAPKPDTLLWYRLACALPDKLPTSALADQAADDAAAAQADYRLVLDQLGACGRTWSDTVDAPAAGPDGQPAPSAR